MVCYYSSLSRLKHPLPFFWTSDAVKHGGNFPVLFFKSLLCGIQSQDNHSFTHRTHTCCVSTLTQGEPEVTQRLPPQSDGQTYTVVAAKLPEITQGEGNPEALVPSPVFYQSIPPNVKGLYGDAK